MATCSFDRTAAIWEEISNIKLYIYIYHIHKQILSNIHNLFFIVGESNEGGTLLRHWVRRANLVDSRTSVTDVKFGPKSFGLILATCSADGIMRIYEAPDAMNLAQWPLQHEVSLKIPSSCLTWNPLLSR